MKIKKFLLDNRTIDPITGCWLWTLVINPSGYGQLFWEGKSQYVHRVSYKEFVKEPTEDILHKFYCPHKHCFNPEHLYEGTDKDNHLDREILGQNHGLYGLHEKRRSITHCPQGHEYTPENTAIYSRGRTCIACRNIRSKARSKTRQI